MGGYGDVLLGMGRGLFGVDEWCGKVVLIMGLGSVCCDGFFVLLDVIWSVYWYLYLVVFVFFLVYLGGIRIVE